MSLERGVLPPGGISLSPPSDGLVPVHTNAFFGTNPSLGHGE